MKKSVSLLASLLLLLPLLTFAAEPRKTLAPKSIDSKKTLPNSVETKPTASGPAPGAYFPIKNVKIPYFQNVGQFAVVVHNIQKGVNLKFNEVYEGATQVVAGFNNKLLLTATDGGKLGKYLTVVFVDLKNNIPHLTSIDPIY